LRFSVSQLKCYIGCGEKWRRRYQEKDWRPIGLPGHVGSAVHEVGREGHRRQKAAKLKRNLILPRTELTQDDQDNLAITLRESLPSSEETKDLAADTFKSMVKEKGYDFSRADLETFGSKEKAEGLMLDQAVDTSAFYIDSCAPGVNPVAVEERVEVNPKNSDLTLVGYIDLVDELWGSEEVVDLKTAKKTPPKTAADTSLQLTFYALLRMAETRRMPDALRLDYLVRTPKLNKLSLVPLKTSRTKADLRELVGRLNVAHEGIKAGIFLPADPDSWQCGYCEYFQECRYTQGRRMRG